MDPAPTPLALRIAREIGEGRIPFAQFMERALYDPEGGYYMKRLPPEVRKRDYYTSPDVGETFGRCLACQLAEMWRVLDGPPRFRIVELGAGRGLLCRDICRALERDAPDCLSRTDYVAVERSPGRRRGLEEGLDSEGDAWRGRVAWVDSVQEVPSGITGVVFSNEFFDALPVHRVRPLRDGVSEVYVRAAGGGGFHEELGEPSTPALAAHFEALGLAPSGEDEKARTEINLKAMDLMRTIGRKLLRGFVLTLDYGHPASELYAPHRVSNGGTLMCYHRHRAHADPYIHVGEQDLTAHVDFTALAMAGREEGLAPAGFTDQHHALVGLGVAEEVWSVPPGEGEEAIRALHRNLSINNLLLPGGLGGALKVLIQHKGVAPGKAQTLSSLQSALYKTSDLLPAPQG
jgi:SAM-dependent MidA family methyltransferase